MNAVRVQFNRGNYFTAAAESRIRKRVVVPEIETAPTQNWTE
jgi:hypothetical protein